MDRPIVWPAEVATTSQDILLPAKNVYIGLAKLAESLLGNSTLINNFACTPTAIPSLSVNIASGEIYIYKPIDVSTYGTLPADSRNILKQGLSLDTVQETLVAPPSVGYSINYLIEISFQEVDSELTTRTYVNAAPPHENYTSDVFTRRSDNAVITVKAGTAAVTGTQVTPSPDIGAVGAYVVTVDYGQTAILSDHISKYPGAPFISSLSDFINQTQADARYAPISTAGVPTGLEAPFPNKSTNVPEGWVLMNDGTIGDTFSSASNRANMDCQALFSLIWDSVDDSLAPVNGAPGNRGVSAAADWVAHKRIKIVGATNGRIILNAAGNDSLISTVTGSSTASLTGANNGSHLHGYNAGAMNVAVKHDSGNSDGGAPTSLTTGSAGSGTPFSIMQPSIYQNWFIKL